MMKKSPKSKNNKEVTKTEEFEQKIIDLARVTRVMAGGKRMRFRACVVIGNKRGQIGFAIAKGADVTLAVNKAVTKAKKDLITVLTKKDTIPHEVRVKYKAAQILLKPAPVGTGIKAGGAVREVLAISGIPNIVAKILGSNNKINNVKATFVALQKLKTASGTRQLSE
jgi:small subunit ribosomal protein S5